MKAFSEGDTTETRAEVLEALALSDLIFPAADRAPTDPRIQLAFTMDQQARPVVPGFTDESRLRSWLGGNGPYATAPAAGFLPAVLSGPFAGLALDPGSVASAFIDRRALELLLERKIDRSAATSDDDGPLVRPWPVPATTG